MQNCDHDTAVFMAESLTRHARSIHRYARAYCALSPENEYIDRDNRARYAKNLKRMAKEMNALMLLARYKGVSRYCNLEQIEAYMESANQILAETAMAIETEKAAG